MVNRIKRVKTLRWIKIPMNNSCSVLQYFFIFYFSWVSHLSRNCQMTNHSGAAANKVIITLNVWCHHKSSSRIDQPLIKTKAGTLGSWKCQTLPAEYTVHLSMSSAGTLQWEWVDGDVYECKERRESWSVGVWWKRKGREEKRERTRGLRFIICCLCVKGMGVESHTGALSSPKSVTITLSSIHLCLL